MHVYSTLGLAAMDSIAADLGIVTYNAADLGTATRGKYAGKRHTTFTLRPQHGSNVRRATADRGQRRLWAVSWEGHRDFMRAMFDRDPNATLDSALARYHGRDEFEMLHGLTGTDINQGYRAKVTAC